MAQLSVGSKEGDQGVDVPLIEARSLMTSIYVDTSRRKHYGCSMNSGYPSNSHLAAPEAACLLARRHYIRGRN